MNVFEKFLSSLLRATRERRLIWAKNDLGEYVARGKIVVVVKEIVPLIAGATETIGTQASEVEAARVSFTVWEGSESCNLVRVILSEALPDWRSHQEQITEKLSNAIRDLNSG